MEGEEREWQHEESHTDMEGQVCGWPSILTKFI